MYQKIIKESNENKIFQYLFKSKEKFVVSDIASSLNMSFPTVKRVVDILLKKNILLEKNKTGDGVGRKARVYELNADFCYSVGITITHNSFRFILINGYCEIKKEKSYTYTLNNLNIIDFLNSSIDNFFSGLAKQERNTLIGIGIATKGIVNKEKNFVEFSNTSSFPLKSLEIITEKYGIPVLIENESNLAVIAESVLGAGQKLNHFVALTLSDSISCSTFQKEQHESFSFKAGRIHHMNINPDGNLCECGAQGCLGTYISDKALITEFNKFFPEIRSFDEIFTPEYLNTHFGKLIIENYIKHIAVGIKNLLFFSNPEKLIITGKICKYEDIIKPGLLENIYTPNHIFYRGKETIAFSDFKDDTAILGAAVFPIVDSLF